MWRLMHFAVAFHAQREGDGDAGRLAEQASFGRDAAKRMRWVFFGRELPRIALLQVMGSAPQLIPSQTTGTRACRSTGVTAQWQKMPGTLAVAPLQKCRLLPCPGRILGSPPSQMRYLHRAAWGQRKARVLVSCCPLAHPGDGAAGGCGSPPAWVLGWVLHADVPREISRHR